MNFEPTLNMGEQALDDTGIGALELPPEQLQQDAGQLRIGEILCQMGAMTLEQIQFVLERQRTVGKVFGEVAIGLGFVRRGEVIAALSQQFSFPYVASRSDVRLQEELVMANSPFSDEVECFRNLRSELLMGVLSPADVDRPAMAVVSPEIGDGKTFVLANLAVAFSQARSRTLVIDADMRSPRLHEVFGTENRSGLSNVLSGRAEARLITPVSSLPNLYMIPAGTVPPNPSELIHLPAFRILLLELMKKFDVVLVDTPAAVHGADASLVAASCGAAMVVARKGVSHATALQALLGRLEKSNVRLVGVMMNVV